MDALQKAINYAGSQTALAQRLGLSVQVVNNWKKRGNVPAEYAPLIEFVTSGAVRAEDIRPDVLWHVIRGKRKAA